MTPPSTTAPPAQAADEVVQRYGLEAIPASVARLTELVARQDADFAEIAEEVEEIVRADESLTARLLQAANPRATCPEDYGITSVEDALMRNGLRAFLILAMGDPIARAVDKMLRTMLRMEEVKLSNANSLPGLRGDHLMGAVAFSGRAYGEVHLRMTLEAAGIMAARLLGTEDGSQMSDDEICDAVGELVNIVAGNFHSNLRDAGLDCRLHPPQIGLVSDFRIRTVQGGCSERMAFVMPNLTLFVDLSVNPWNK